jgi:hypothetical protein
MQENQFTKKGLYSLINRLINNDCVYLIHYSYFNFARRSPSPPRPGCSETSSINRYSATSAALSFPLHLPRLALDVLKPNLGIDIQPPLAPLFQILLDDLPLLFLLENGHGDFKLWEVYRLLRDSLGVRNDNPAGCFGSGQFSCS